jgi:hypothetical protein
MRLKENEIIERFQRDPDKFAPLTMKSIEKEIRLTERLPIDFIIEFCIADGPCFKAMVEIKNIATPRTISMAANQLYVSTNKLNDKEIIPLVIVPYMGTEQAKMLQKDGISWIDLCGNMMITVDSKIYIERTGKKNQFPDTSPIKKIFEGTSSLVSRALLLKKEPFKSLYEVVNYINDKGGNITLATVSKVLISLEEELLITKTKSGIVVNTREELLDKLLEGYRIYTERNKNVTYTFAINGRSSFFNDFFREQKVDYAMCGFSAALLKDLALTNRTTVFIKSINEARNAFERNNISIKPDTEFGELDLIETRNPCVWFNLQDKPSYSIVDDIELYLEMMIDTPRGPKIAEILKERILKGQE